MTLTTDSPAATTTHTDDPLATALPAWNEPAGATARGTVIVLAGRGEAGGVYERFGRRISADAYRVRVVEDPTLDLAAARARVAFLLADPDLPSPKVLVGSDAGAALALAALTDTPAPSDASPFTNTASPAAGLILVGLPAATAPTETSGQVDDTELRSACPVHRRTLTNPALVTTGALTRQLPDELARALAAPVPLGLPLLAIHGESDVVSPVAEAVAVYQALAATRILTIPEGRHDVLNDVSHRSVAAEIVLFLERLRLVGSDGVLPRVLTDATAF